MVSFHILLLDRAGNNLVNADFSPYSRMFFAVKHIYLTLYILRICRVAPIYSVPPVPCAVVLAGARCSCGRMAVRPPARSLPADRRACGRVTVPAPVCARPPARGRTRAGGRVCAWARAWPRLLPLFAPIMAHFIRLYGSFSRRASARWAFRKLF